MTSTLAMLAANVALTTINVGVIIHNYQSIKASKRRNAKRLAEIGVEQRDVWFWQADSLMNEGWTMGWWNPTWNPVTWIDYALVRLRPTLQRSIDGGG